MRYFEIVISDPVTGDVFVPQATGQTGFKRVPASAVGGRRVTYTSLIPNATVSTVGGHNPAAPRVEIDLPVVVMHLPDAMANPYVRIRGVSAQEIGQSANLTGMNISVSGGMSKGLPLANYQQSGLLTAGTVKQCIGNKIGYETSLEIYLQTSASPSVNQISGQPPTSQSAPVPPTTERPANLVFVWGQGQPFMSALINTLSIAFPKYRVVGAVSPNLVWSGSPAIGYFDTLEQFALYLNGISRVILGGPIPDPAAYAGVGIVLRAGVLTISDGTIQTRAKQIQFTDLVGSPTANEPNRIQIVTCMRGDLNVLDYLTLPLGNGVIQAGSQANIIGGTIKAQGGPGGQGVLFQGTYRIDRMRHLGDSRDPSGLAWVSTFDCGLVQPDPSAPASLSTLYGPASGGYSYSLPG
jgi:hypothetical protein